MDLDRRVERLERWVALDGTAFAEVNREIRRDLAAESEVGMVLTSDCAAACDALRSQVADLTRERDSLATRLTLRRDERDRYRDDRDAALARAEKAERERDEANAKAETYRSDWYAAKNEFGDAAGKLRAEIRARDATIAEARVLLTEVDTGRLKGQWMPRRDAWLAGQPAGAAEPHPEPHSCEAAEQAIESLEADLLEARAEVARLEGLVKRCEAWFEWHQSPTYRPSPEATPALLADLRAGRAS